MALIPPDPIPSGQTFDKKIIIKNYVKKNISRNAVGQDETYSSVLTEFDTKKMCDFNNGIFLEPVCSSESGDSLKTIAASQLCMDTGYNYNYQNNTCTKDIDNTDAALQLQCTNKTNATGTDNIWDQSSERDSEKPCGVCLYDTTNKRCRSKNRLHCLRLSETECNADNSCQYYRDNMDGDTSNNIPNKINFNCIAASGEEVTDCGSKTTESTCTGNNCEWTCPIETNGIPEGYNIAKADDSGEPTQTNLSTTNTDNYYSASDLTITCDTGWTSVTGIAENERAQCIDNSDTTTNTNHPQILRFQGCQKTITCKNTEREYSRASIQAAFDNDPTNFVTQYPSFVTDGILDPKKLPNENGDYPCLEPSSIIGNAENIIGWDNSTCCKYTGLCSENTNTNENTVVCPSGKTIKKTYYPNNPELLPIRGNDIITCCAIPEVATITMKFTGDFEINAGEKKSSDERETFISNFKTDIKNFINNDTIVNVTVTDDMIDILNIKEGSIVVIFRILKDTNDNVILISDLERLFPNATVFPTLGLNTDGNITFEEYDPSDEYLIYLKKLNIGINWEEIIIGIVAIVIILLLAYLVK